MDYKLYDSILLKSIFLIGIICIIGIIVFLVLFIYTIKKFNGISKIITAIILALLIVIYLAFFLWRTSNYIHDLQDKSYIVYEGKVNIDTYGQGIIMYLNNNSVKLTVGHPVYKKGHYYGKVTYSENSKVLLDYELQEKKTE